MNLRRFSCCLLCALVLLSVPFSASATVVDDVYSVGDDVFTFGILGDDSYGVGTLEIAPEDVEQGKIRIAMQNYSKYGNDMYLYLPWTTTIYTDDEVVNSVVRFYDTTQVYADPDYFFTDARLRIYTENSDVVLADKGINFDFAITNLANAVTIYDDETIVKQSNWWHGNIDRIVVYFRDRLGVDHKVTIPSGEFSSKQTTSDTVGFSFSAVAPVDAYEIYIALVVEPFYAEIEDYLSYQEYTYKSTYGFSNSRISMSISEPDSSGFFASIIEWLQSIRDRIQSVAQSIANLGSTMTNVWNSIKNLPSQIWTYISDGLKNLFIPSEQDMVDIKDDWDSLLSDRFGAVYEAGTLVVEWANNFQEQSAKDTISMPSVTVDLAGTPFTFGGYEVELVPDRFDFLVDMLRGVLDICCTLLFVNAMKKRYDNVVGGGGA